MKIYFFSLGETKIQSFQIWESLCDFFVINKNLFGGYYEPGVQIQRTSVSPSATKSFS
jgi:hypothetical protein